jgi:hypothetical protein
MKNIASILDKGMKFVPSIINNEYDWLNDIFVLMNGIMNGIFVFAYLKIMFLVIFIENQSKQI